MGGGRRLLAHSAVLAATLALTGPAEASFIRMPQRERPPPETIFAVRRAGPRRSHRRAHAYRARAWRQMLMLCGICEGRR